MTDTLEKAPELRPNVDATEVPAELDCPEADCEYSARPGIMAKAQLSNHRRQKHGYKAPAKAKRNTQKKARTDGQKPERAPRVASASAPRTSRRSAAKYLGHFWLALAKAVPSPRAQQAMLWELPAAGPILDKMAAGTIVDRLILQRMAKEEERWGDVGSLVTLPAVGAMIDAGIYDNAPPVIQKAVEGIAEDSIIRLLGAVLDDVARRRRELEALERKAREAGFQPTQNKDGTVTPAMRHEVEQMLAMFFARDVMAPPTVAPEQAWQPA